MSIRKPPISGPATVPTRKLDSNLANIRVLFSQLDASAIYA